MSDAQKELARVRELMRKKKGGGRDPNEWRPDKAEEGKTLRWKLFILPPTDSMNGLWFYRHGAHYIDNRMHQCPRLHDDIKCPLCDFGFDMMRETDDRDKRREIRRALLSSARYAVNIYFPAYESTPMELRGRVFWYSMPETLYNICEEVVFREGPGDDPDDPAPWGFFYEPNAAHPLILEAKKKGDYNSYESSRFGGQKVPISKKDGMIDKILDQRFDLPNKFDERDIDTLQAIVDNLSGKTTSRPVITEQKTKTKTKQTTTKSTTQNDDKSEEEPEVETETETEVETEVETDVQTTDNEVETEPEVETETNENTEAEGVPETEDDAELQDLLAKLKSD
ncbi:MAG: hypothetical protein GF411_13850 [Candidatus Lokiarchaeota archaeon]|nr:hypothetical protein [Candidatus Lokiarchaeota archaeon]